jgi:hypothetical protein
MRSNPIARRVTLAVMFLVAASLTGCDEASITDPEISGGGQELVLDFERFATDVAPIFTNRGCDNLACHGGGIRGTFQLSPASAKDADFDFEQASLQVDPVNRDASSLLLKPLSEIAGGLPHAGDGPTTTINSVDDPDYATLRAWIQEGELR